MLAHRLRRRPNIKPEFTQLNQMSRVCWVRYTLKQSWFNAGPPSTTLAQH